MNSSSFVRMILEWGKDARKHIPDLFKGTSKDDMEKVINIIEGKEDLNEDTAENIKQMVEQLYKGEISCKTRVPSVEELIEKIQLPSPTSPDSDFPEWRVLRALPVLSEQAEFDDKSQLPDGNQENTKQQTPSVLRSDHPHAPSLENKLFALGVSQATAGVAQATGERLQLGSDPSLNWKWVGVGVIIVLVIIGGGIWLVRRRGNKGRGEGGRGGGAATPEQNAGDQADGKVELEVDAAAAAPATQPAAPVGLQIMLPLDSVPSSLPAAKGVDGGLDIPESSKSMRLDGLKEFDVAVGCTHIYNGVKGVLNGDLHIPHSRKTRARVLKDLEQVDVDYKHISNGTKGSSISIAQGDGVSVNGI